MWRRWGNTDGATKTLKVVADAPRAPLKSEPQVHYGLGANLCKGDGLQRVGWGAHFCCGLVLLEAFSPETLSFARTNIDYE